MASTGDPRRPARVKTPAPRRRRDERGFSLNETLVALGVTALAFMAALSLLAFDNKVYNRSDAQQETVREGRYALNMLERDLQMAGFSVDIETPDAAGVTGQPMIVGAGPWDIVFNADISDDARAILDGVDGDETPTGYAPPSFIGPAETIRYTLDSTGDGLVTPADRTDQMDEQVVANDGLYVLQREVYGYDGTDNVNPAGAVALVRGPVAYPSGAQPEPLFQYWGYFNSSTRLDLWGDDGTPAGTAGNGKLEAGELTDLTPVTGEDADGDGTLDSGEDRNGNGVWEPRVSELIRKVDVTVTSETIRPDVDYVDSLRSDTGDPFRFHTFVLRSQVQPRNIEILGASNCGDPPAAPTNVTWEKTAGCDDALTDGAITLNWDLSADDGGGERDVSDYGILRSNSAAAFGPDPVAEAARGGTTINDRSAIMQGWPPVQNWYSVEARDCRPATGASDTVGPYPENAGPAYPMDYLAVQERPGDDGTNVDINFAKSWDEGSNHSGFGGVASGYWVYRDVGSDYRCVLPIHTSAINATGAARYTWTDNSANSTSGPNFGALYYYWMRATNGSDLSPYSPTYCTRTYKGPALPTEPHARVIATATATREVWFSRNPANDAASYDPYQINYKIYRSATNLSKVGKTAGYTATDYRNFTRWTGLVWGVRSASPSVYYSVAGGAASTWAVANSTSPPDFSGDPPSAVSFGSRLHGIVTGSNGKIYHTNNAGYTWRPETVGSANYLDVAHVNALTAVAVGASNTLRRTVNGGYNWVAVSSGIVGTPNLVTVAAAQSPPTALSSISRVLVVGDTGGVGLSTNAGASFVSKTAVPVVSPNAVVSACATIDDSNQIWYFVGTKTSVYQATGPASEISNWTLRAMPGACTTGWLLACSWDNSHSAKSVMAVCKDSAASKTAYLSNDGGLNWSSEAVPWGSSTSATDVAMLDSYTAFVATNKGGISRRGCTSDSTCGWTSGADWTASAITGGSVTFFIAARPEIAWEDAGATPTGTAGLAPYAQRFYVVTSAYAAGSGTMNGESGIAVESPTARILVDACNKFEVVAP